LEHFVGSDDENPDSASLASASLVSRSLTIVAVPWLYRRVGWPAYDTLLARPDLAAYVVQVRVPPSRMMVRHEARGLKLDDEAREQGESRKHTLIRWENGPFNNRLRPEVSCIYRFMPVDRADVRDSSATTTCRTYPPWSPSSLFS
jgi:hypothetical protein